MADYRSSFRRNSNSSSREDPRLSGRNSESRKDNVSPPKQTNWQGQTGQYPMQTSYQHLQGTMYSDPNQYSSQGYQNAYGGYQNYSTSYNSYEGYGQSQSTNYMSNLQPGPPGEEYPQGGWAPVGPGYSNQQSTSSTADKNQSNSEQTDGIAQEMKHQKAELVKQRDEYNKRTTVLRKELELLRRQKQELQQEHSSDRNTEMILRENGKLQVEIQNKLKDAYNVIDILTGIIGDGERNRKTDDDTSPKRESKTSLSLDLTDFKYNYVHYDPELHWCRMCDIFPKTAKDLLLHLQSKEHRDLMQEDEVPWHKLPPEPEFPLVEGAPKKRLPIKGLQFFVSTTAWYCRLCDSWIGDLHCASQHLKSIKHSQNYSNFVEQNPHWEIEWLKDREKALDRVSRRNRSSDSEDNHDKKKKRKKDKHSSPTSGVREKRKKKRSKKRKKDSSDSSSSSSSSSSSEEDNEKDTSKSIHVAMRNKMKLQAQMMMNEELSGKWEAIGRLVEERKKKDAEVRETEDSMINQWMTVKQPHDQDKELLTSLKGRLKQKQEVEKLKYAEIERKRLEKERIEQELKEKQEKEAREKEDAKRKEREEMERLKEIREQVKFKASNVQQKDKYRKKRSASKSPEYKLKSRSPSYDKRRKTPERYRRQENGRRSTDYDQSPRHKRKHDDRKPPPPPSYKKLPFIGRMPLFKNKKPEDRGECKEIKKEEYDIPRVTRFQPGNLARAFIPEPEVVCFPKLSCYPDIPAPPPPAPKIVQQPPAPPKISEPIPKAPPPPKINEPVKEERVEKSPEEKKPEESTTVDNNTVEDMMIMEDDNPLNDYHAPGFDNAYQYDYSMMYQPPVFDFTQDVHVEADESVPLSHTRPLQPPPLPPDDPNDDLAMLGLSSDDLAVQSFMK